jgi:hypothetical protein
MIIISCEGRVCLLSQDVLFINLRVANKLLRA